MKRHVLAIALTLHFAVYAMEQDCKAIEQVIETECSVCQRWQDVSQAVAASMLFGSDCCNRSFCASCSAELRLYKMSECPYCADYGENKGVTVEAGLLRQLFSKMIAQSKEMVQMKDHQTDMKSVFEAQLLEQEKSFLDRMANDAKKREELEQKKAVEIREEQSKMQRAFESQLKRQLKDFQDQQKREQEERAEYEWQMRDRLEQEAADNNYYNILSIPRNAKAGDIRKAYRKIMGEINVEKLAGNAIADEAIFRQYELANKAYLVLSNPILKKAYDAELANNPKVVAQVESKKDRIELMAASEVFAGPANRRLIAQLYHAILHDAGEEIPCIIEQIAQGKCAKHFNINAALSGLESKTPCELAIALARPNAVKALLKCGAKPIYPRNANGNHVSRPAIEYSLEVGDIKSAIAILRCGNNQQPPSPNSISQVFKHYNECSEDCLGFLEEIFNRGLINTHPQGYIGHIKNTQNNNCNLWDRALLEDGHSVLSKPIMDLFLKKGLNPNQRLIIGESPLRCAIQVGCPRSVELLLEAGADVNQYVKFYDVKRGNITGTPIAFAMQQVNDHNKGAPNPVVIKAYDKIIELLKAHGGRRA